jgi:hypothetical protein
MTNTTDTNAAIFTMRFMAVMLTCRA